MEEFDIDKTITPGPEQPTPGSGILGRIDDYEIVRELGSGGWGSVYLVRSRKTGSEYAVKGLPSDARLNPASCKRVLENFKCVEKLRHERIATMLPVIYPKQVIYYQNEVSEKLRIRPGDPMVVMDYAPGITLSEWRKRQPNGKVAPEKAAEIVRQIAEALDEAHRQKILHRDIKSTNVIIDEHINSFDCKVLDFGIAAEMPPQIWHTHDEEVRDAGGSPRYMAPEQWCKEPQGPGTDQYALAVLYCELVTGEVPFQNVFDTGDIETMKAAVVSQRPDLSGIPRWARKAVARALEKNINRRYSSCLEFAMAVARRNHKTILIIGGRLAAMAVAVVATYAVRMQFTQSSQKEIATVPTPAEPVAVPQMQVPKVDSDVEPPIVREIPHKHCFGEPIEIKTQTCTDSGIVVRSCKECTVAQTNEPPALGHSPGCWITNEQPTCVKDGERTIYCTRCGWKLSIQAIAKLGHDWINGERQRSCRRCAETIKKSVDPQPRPSLATKPAPVPASPNASQLLSQAIAFAEMARDKKRSRKERLDSWRKCKDVADEILKLEASNVGAKRLKSSAENALENMVTHQDYATPLNTGVKDRNGFAF